MLLRCTSRDDRELTQAVIQTLFTHKLIMCNIDNSAILGCDKRFVTVRGMSPTLSEEAENHIRISVVQGIRSVTNQGSLQHRPRVSFARTASHVRQYPGD